MDTDELKDPLSAEEGCEVSPQFKGLLMNLLKRLNNDTAILAQWIGVDEETLLQWLRD
ncbi:MAG: hypothetical protein GY851_17190 [bacterium]|nr:hypothetical protein [bacterium]